MRIGICDDMQIDIKAARKIIEYYIITHNIKASIHEYTSRLELLNEKQNIDVIFLDIDLGNDNGISLARDIHEKWKYCQIVFLTQYIDYVSDVYSTEHAYFVLKDHLADYIDRIFKIIEHKQIEANTKLYFKLPHDHTVALVPDDIVYIERHTRKSIIHTKHKTYEVDDKISVLMEKMKNHDFARCHNSFIVSLRAVTEIQVDHLVLLETIVIPVSRRYRQKFNETFTSFSALQLP